MRKAVLFISVLLAIAAMHVALSIPTQQLKVSMVRPILDSQDVHIDYVRVENSGVAFGVFDSARRRPLYVVLAALSAITLAALFLSLVDGRYTLQLIALTCIVAPSFTHAGEQLLLGYDLDYFEIRFGVYAFPLMVIGIPLVLLQCAALILGQIETDQRLAAVFWLGVNALTAWLVVVVWFMIPSRRIGALVLRGFAGDKRDWPIVRSLQKSVRRSLRLAGVVDPRESRRFIHLLYWLFMPFVFGIGDMGRVNAFRYNVFLTQEWKADLKCLFATVHYAIFDCRTLSSNVAWEINLAREMFPADRVFFLANCNVEALRKELATFEYSIDVDSAQFFTVADWRNLSNTLLSRI